jgi:NCS1 family nucleobase:cation symporter-1
VTTKNISKMRSSLANKLKWLEVPHPKDKVLTVLKNPDLEPMPKERRLWGFWSFFGYWAVPNISIGTYSVGSSLLLMGLSVPQTISAIIVGNLIIILYTVLNAGPGSTFKIGYTMCQRMIFGIFGSYLGILIRILLSIVFYASMSWLGCLGIVVMLSAWSKDYMNMENTFPESVHMAKRDFIAFFCFNVIEVGFFFFKPEKMGPLINGSCFITFIALTGVFGYELHKCYELTGGPGALWSAPATVTNSDAAWAWFQVITIFYGGLSPNCTNMSDYSRFSNSYKKIGWATGLSTAIFGTMITIMGMVTASNTLENYGTSMWLPTDVCLKWLEENYSSGRRAAVFFCGLAFASSQLTFNVTANGFAGGMDLAGIFPKYINIFRGALITALISWACQPWNFYNTASSFNSVMASFGVVMSPIMGIVVADFYLVRRCRLRVSHLYSLDKNKDFFYSYGFNWRAYLCFFAATVPGLPGLAAVVNPKTNIPAGLIHYFQNSTIFSFTCPLILYYAICWFFPMQGQGEVDEYDYFDVLSEKELEKLGMKPFDGDHDFEGMLPLNRMSSKSTVDAFDDNESEVERVSYIAQNKV